MIGLTDDFLHTSSDSRGGGVIQVCKAILKFAPYIRVGHRFRKFSQLSLYFLLRLRFREKRK